MDNETIQLMADFLSVEFVRRPDGFGYNRPSESWSKLFNYYNKNSGEKHLGMACQPCYEKVYSFIKKKLLDECLAVIH